MDRHRPLPVPAGGHLLALHFVPGAARREGGAAGQGGRAARRRACESQVLCRRRRRLQHPAQLDDHPAERTAGGAQAVLLALRPRSPGAAATRQQAAGSLRRRDAAGGAVARRTTPGHPPARSAGRDCASLPSGLAPRRRQPGAETGSASNPAGSCGRGAVAQSRAWRPPWPSGNRRGPPRSARANSSDQSSRSAVTARPCTSPAGPAHDLRHRRLSRPGMDLAVEADAELGDLAGIRDASWRRLHGSVQISR